MDWFDKAVERLEQELQDGHLTQAEFNSEMRELQREYNDLAHEAAQEAFDSYYY